jgi:uncharacterized membrane protein YpjA
MRAVHRDWAFVVVALNMLSAAWGLTLYRRRLAATRGFWTALLTGYAALAAQVVIGVVMYQSRKPANRLHPFYGFVLLIAAVLSLAFRAEAPRRALLILSLVALFVGVVGVRATLTGFR